MSYTRILRKPIQLRIDNDDQWSYFDPTLLDGEIGLVRDTDNFKIGDGINRWSQLETKTFGGGGGGTSFNLAALTAWASVIDDTTLFVIQDPASATPNKFTALEMITWIGTVLTEANIWDPKDTAQGLLENHTETHAPDDAEVNYEQVSGAEIEAHTETELRSWSPVDVATLANLLISSAFGELTITAEEVGAKSLHGIHSGLTASDLSVTDTTFTIFSSHVYYYQSTRVEQSAGKTVELSLGVEPELHYVYYSNSSGTLSSSTSPFNYITQVPIAIVFWNGSVTRILPKFFHDTMDLQGYLYQYYTKGVQVIDNGWSLSAPTIGSPSTISIGSGMIIDGDNRVSYGVQTECVICYQTGATTHTFIPNQSAVYPTTVSLVNSAAGYALQSVATDKYINIWMYAAIDKTNSIWCFVETNSTGGYATAAEAFITQPPDLRAKGLPTELRLIYRFIYKGDETLAITEDYRTTDMLPAAGGVKQIAANSVRVNSIPSIPGTNAQSLFEAIANLDIIQSNPDITEYVKRNILPATNGFNLEEYRGTLSLDGGDLVLAPAIAEAKFEIVIDSIRYERTTEERIAVPLTAGEHYFYYDTTPTLQVASNPTVSQIHDIIVHQCIVAYIYRTAAAVVLFNDERHDYIVDGLSHLYLHLTQRTKLLSGGALGDFVVDGDGSLDSHAQFSMGAVHISDDGLSFDYDAVPATTGIRVMYKEGATGSWSYGEVANHKVLTTGTGRLAWNQNTGGTWGLTECGDNTFVCVHYFITNGVYNYYIGVVGQANYNTAPEARESAITELATLITAGLPAPELVFVGTVLFQTRNSYTNSVNARVISVDGNDYVDWRSTTITPLFNVSSHSNLSDLSHDDHPQYALLSGRVSEETLNITNLANVQDINNQVTFPDSEVHVASDVYVAGDLRNQAKTVDMGGYFDHDTRGINKTFITDQILHNCRILGSAINATGSIKTESGQLLVYLDGVWQVVVTNFRFREDETEGYELEHRPVGYDLWYEVMSGNSNVKAINGLPLVQQYTVSMGAYQVPMCIDGGEL